MASLRHLTELGIATFEAYLTALHEDGTLEPPLSLLTAMDASGPIAGESDVVQRVFPTKLAMARYVADSFPQAVQEANAHARGVWAWLALFWIDQLLPPDPATGKRAPNKIWYYVPQESHFVEYRHLLLGPYRTYRAYGEDARLLLTHPISVWSDVEEQLAGKREFLRLRGALAAADVLYFDSVKGKPKRGITNRNRPGNVRRLRDVVRQFNRTYDLHSMSGQQVVSLLPPEFDDFRS